MVVRPTCMCCCRGRRFDFVCGCFFLADHTKSAVLFAKAIHNVRYRLPSVLFWNIAHWMWWGVTHTCGFKSITEAMRGTSKKFIQISAAGVSEDASTEFFRSKARGDAALAATDLDFVILRPALVIGSQAYGGIALLRAAAANPSAAHARRSRIRTSKW